MQLDIVTITLPVQTSLAPIACVCAGSPCEDGFLCDEPLASSAVRAPVVETDDVDLCFRLYATNLCCFVSSEKESGNKMKLKRTWSSRVAYTSTTSAEGPCVIFAGVTCRK
jgi:hypothetical protein